MKRKISTLIVFLILSIGSHAQETMTVLTDGVGKDVESATQRAAEAALTQVVGSFIDSTKMIEKRKEIRDGVKKQTKKISSKISEYSQGMIQSIEVLEVSDDDGFTRVTAKVSVRIEDFKNYIKQTVLAEKKVRKGLLSKIKIKKKQSKNLADLVVAKVLKDIISTQVIVPVIDGEIEEVTKITTIEFMDRKVPGDGYILKIPVKITLDPSFLENAMRVLDETADQKIEGLNVSDGGLKRDYLYSIMLGDFYLNGTAGTNAYIGDSPWNSLSRLVTGSNHNPGHGIGRATGSSDFIVINPEELLTYTFPERSARKLCRASEIGNAGYGGKFHIPDIRMSFLSETGEVLRKEIIKLKRNNTQQSSFSYVRGAGKIDNGYLVFPPTSMLLTSLIKDRSGVSCMIFINTVSKYTVLTKVSEDVLNNTDKVVFSYIKSNKKLRKHPFAKE